MQNYRPLFAAMIKNRLLQTYEPWVQTRQFSFRPKKSTSQAIFLARRLMDISERTGTNLTITLLDWKMAFDKVDQQKILQVLRRLQVPPRMLQATTHIYFSPQFRVSAGHTESEYLVQRSGIRQGCPLSPYLFVLLMAVMFSNIKARLNTPKQREQFNTLKYFMLTTRWFLATTCTLTISTYYWKKYKRNPAITIWN